MSQNIHKIVFGFTPIHKKGQTYYLDKSSSFPKELRYNFLTSFVSRDGSYI